MRVIFMIYTILFCGNSRRFSICQLQAMLRSPVFRLYRRPYGLRVISLLAVKYSAAILTRRDLFAFTDSLEKLAADHDFALSATVAVNLDKSDSIARFEAFVNRRKIFGH